MIQTGRLEYDVAIIGGGPGGATTGALLARHAPHLRVGIFEKEKFPREHVGESLLPPINAVLLEMGCWDKIEAANFPVKVGATFRWGRTPELWDFELFPAGDFQDVPRPSKYEGQRQFTSFQVERAIYDNILLRHAEELGCAVHEETQVGSIEAEGDHIERLVLRDGREVRAKHYVDASGHAGVLRRAMGVKTEVPTQLRNIAFWDYWDNTEWAVEIGVGGTRIQIMSVGFGWIWFIPIGPSRSSIGLVCNADYYKQSGRTPEELYLEAIGSEERLRGLVANATRQGTVHTTTDWSFFAERVTGKNWMLVGESAGFADPVLSAGMTLTHLGAREAAYTIAAIEQGEHDRDWLLHHYGTTQQRRVKQHIRFADYWYAANAQFEDLKEHCKDIAKASGLRLTPDAAWRWLASGGFSNDFIGQAGIGAVTVASLKQILQKFSDKSTEWILSRYNVFELNLRNAERIMIPTYVDGRIEAVPCLIRGDRRLPLVGVFGVLVELLERHKDAQSLFKALNHAVVGEGTLGTGLEHAMQCLEVMVSDQWVMARLDKKKPRIDVTTPDEGDAIHTNRDPVRTAAGTAEG
jgi:flavin-dependent dehydrogenase